MSKISESKRKLIAQAAQDKCPYDKGTFSSEESRHEKKLYIRGYREGAEWMALQGMAEIESIKASNDFLTSQNEIATKLVERERIKNSEIIKERDKWQFEWEKILSENTYFHEQLSTKDVEIERLKKELAYTFENKCGWQSKAEELNLRLSAKDALLGEAMKSITGMIETQFFMMSKEYLAKEAIEKCELLTKIKAELGEG